MSEQNINCPICAGKMEYWQLDQKNSLLQCQSCLHVLRDLDKANCNCRNQAWGGVGLFDKIRNYLVFESLNSVVNKNLKSVFELGFGSGWLLSKFLQAGKQVSGVDKELLGIQINADVKQKGKLFFGSAEDFEIPKKQYDLIMGIHLIEHLKEPVKVFTSAFNGLNDGGVLYFMTPNGNSLGLKLFKSAWWNLEDPTHCCFFSEKSIKIALEKAGFKNIVVKRSFSDSMMVEVNSFIRLFYTPTGNHGVLSGKLIQIIDLLLLFPFLLLRLLIPSLRSTIEVIAKKE